MMQPPNPHKKRKRRPVSGNGPDSEDEFGFSQGGSKKMRKDDAFEDTFKPKKQDDHIKWTPMGAPKATRINRNLLDYEKENCGPPNNFCFACRRVGDNLPYFNTARIHDLLRFLYNGLRTTSEDEHYIQGHEMFDTMIRIPTNAKIEERRKKHGHEDEFCLIPEWRPSMIKEHMESHHTDPELTMELLARNTLSITRDIYNHCLFKKGIIRTPKPRPVEEHVVQNDVRDVPVPENEEREDREESEVQETEYDEEEVIKIDPDNWKIYKEATELSIKILRSDPRKMLPFYTKDRFIVEQQAGHPFFDLEHKKLVNGNNTPVPMTWEKEKRCAL